MLEQTLNTPHFIGRDKFVWWVGQVEKSVDTAKNSNRCKVRIVGYHSDRNSVKADQLPWAHILMPPTNSQSGGSGKKAMLTPGQWVVGFFLDGDECQVPCVWGCLGGTIGTDNGSTVPGDSFQTPQNIWSKPDLVKPSNSAKTSSSPSADKSNTMPHIAGSNTPASPSSSSSNAGAGAGDSTGSEDDFEKVESGETKPKTLVEDELASKGQTAKDKEQTYKVAVADGVCGTNASMEHMATKLTEFIEVVSDLQQQGNLWIDVQTGAVVDIQSKIQNYSSLIGNILQAPMSAVMRYAESEARKAFPALFGAAADPDPSKLKGLKKSVNEILSLIKCLFQNELLSKLGNMIKDMLMEMINSAKGAVINAVDCAVQGAIGKTVGSILSSINDIMGKVTEALSALGGVVGEINGIIGKVLGFAQNILGILGCFNKNLTKCVRSKVYSTKEGAKRPKPFFTIGANPELDNTLAALAGSPIPICDEAVTPTSNSQEVVPSALGDTVSQTITGTKDILGGQSSGTEEVGETFEGYIPIEAIQAFQDGAFDITAALEASGVQNTDVALAFTSSVEAAIESAFGDPEQAYEAAYALSELGVLCQYTSSSGVGPTYGVSGILHSFDADTGVYNVRNLDKPLLRCTWIRSASGHCVQVGESSVYKPKSPACGRGARIILPIDENGFPKRDAIVLDGGSGYGNGQNGNQAPDAFVVNEMYDCETDEEIEDYYLKGTMFVDANGSITAVSFNNDQGYCFKTQPQVAINCDGGSLGDPTENDAVKDPNTLTYQTDTTLVLSSANPAINGILQGFHITNVGFGYKNPVISITGGGGSGAAAEVVDYYGRIVDIKITDSGSGYTSLPNIVIKDEPIPGEDPNSFRGVGARVYPIIRYLSAADPSLVKKIGSQETVEVVDCP